MNTYKGFPAKLPTQKPTDRELSKGMERMYDVWNPHEDRGNEFFSNFKYSRLSGLEKDENITRRDPSKVIKVGDTYYVWYTKRQTVSGPVGSEKCTDTLPAVDWDLAEIWYATSKDGFEWKEEGVAVPRAPKGQYGDRTIITADILVDNGKYYLYFQVMTGDTYNVLFNVGMASSDSPDGPWIMRDGPIIDRGGKDDWDGRVIDDPFVIKYKGQYWIYYKGEPLYRGDEYIIRAQGVAISDSPEGPFVKSPLNPLINSGHETCFYPYKDGVCSIISIDGPEKNTVQYAPDGLNFEVKSNIQMVPVAPGPYCPDAFADNLDGRGISWGLCHINVNGGGADKGCFLARFDSDLNRDVSRPEFKVNNIRFGEETYFQGRMQLDEKMKEEIMRMIKRS